MTPATTFFGSVLVILAIWTAWPQAVHIIRSKHIEGVDARTVLIALITMEAWTAYTLKLSDWPAFASSAGPLLAWATTLALLGHHGHPDAKRYLLLTLLGAAGVTAITLTPLWWLLGWGAGIGTAIWTIPQLRTAFSHVALDGVSIIGYVIFTIENIGWIIYAVLTNTPAYGVGSLVQGPACALIAWKAWQQKRVRFV